MILIPQGLGAGPQQNQVSNLRIGKSKYHSLILSILSNNKGFLQVFIIAYTILYF